MWPYWLMFLLPAWMAMTDRQRPLPVTGFYSLRLDGGWWLTVVALTLLIGFRFKVGGDWAQYQRFFDSTTGRELGQVLGITDPGYTLINWLSDQAGWGIFGVNLISSAIFTAGLVVFCRGLPRPWLALAVSVPYLVIVLGMGYTRQGIALGLVMLGLVALVRQWPVGFVVAVLLGATFHKSAVILLPVAALAATRNRGWILFWILVSSLVGYKSLVADSFDSLYANYVQAQIQSRGALIRILMCAVPAVILLLWRRRFLLNQGESRLWLIFGLMSLGCLAVVLMTPATTAVDRIALYLLPLQLLVFTHVPDVFGIPGRRNEDLVAVVLLFYAAVLYVWLNFADNSGYWIPYRFYPLESDG